jgi:hypothetical protein
MACGATLKRTYEFDPLYSPTQVPPVKRRCIPVNMAQVSPANQLMSPSTFAAMSPKLTKEEIAARIGTELKRMQKRKQLFSSPMHSPPLTTCSTLGRQSPSHSSDAVTSSSASSDFPFLSLQSASGASSPKQKDVPLFTFKQVAMICERTVQEQEDKLRENYEKVLSTKLSEQYEAFLRFNHDQLQKHYRTTPVSYLS